MNGINQPTVKLGFLSNLKWWQATIMIAVILVAAGWAASHGVNVSVNVDVQARVETIEKRLDIPVNSSLSAFLKSNTYIICTVDAYATLLNGTNGKLVEYLTNQSQVFMDGLNNASVLGGSVYVFADPYSVAVIVPNNVRFVIDKGATGINYTVASGANCIVDDFNSGIFQYYSNGLPYSVFNYASGTLLTQSANLTTIYVNTITSLSGNLQILKLVVESGSSWPANPAPGYLFYNNASNVLFYYNSTTWVSGGGGGTYDYNQLINKPDLSQYLFENGTRPLTADWNASSFGIYGLSSVNATSLYVSTVDQLISGSGVKILHFVVESGTSFPNSPVTNQEYFRTDLGFLFVYNNTWIPIGYPPATYPYGNLTGIPNTFPYANLTGVPILLFANGSQGLTGNWNVGGSYGIYGLTYINVTTVYVKTIDSIDGTTVQILKLVVENGTSFPASPVAGRLFYRQDLFTLYYYNSTAWVACSGGGSDGADDDSAYLLISSATNFLFQNGTRALTADWNIGSYGIYGLTFVNATTIYVTTINQLTAGQGVKILQLIVENGTSFPASPIQKQLFYRTDLGYLYVYNNTSWNPIGYPPITYPYANLTGVPNTFPWGNLTGVPLLIYANGSQGLTADWNVAGYGLYGATWFNATSISISGNIYFNQGQAVNMTFWSGSAFPSSPVVGQPFYLTTNNTLWYYNGTWVSVASGTGAQGPQGPAGPAGPTSGFPFQYMLFKNSTATYEVNGTTGAIDFSLANDTTVFLNALNNMTTGGRLFLKNGEYDLNPINIATANTTVEGENMYSTILKENPSMNANFITISGTGDTLQNLKIDGNYPSETDGDALTVQGNYARVFQVYIYQAAKHGVKVYTSCYGAVLTAMLSEKSGREEYSISGKRCVVQGCTANQSGVVSTLSPGGFYVYGDAQDCVLTGCISSWNNQAGFYLRGDPANGRNTIIGSTAYYNQQQGLILMGCTNGMVEGFVADDNSRKTSGGYDAVLIEQGIASQPSTYNKILGLTVNGTNQALAIHELEAGDDYNEYIGGSVFGLVNTTKVFIQGPHSYAKMILGFNPVGYIALPAYGAYIVDALGTGTLLNNTLYTNIGTNKMIYISGGTVSNVTLDGQLVFATTNISVTVPSGKTFLYLCSIQPTSIIVDGID